jgi:hypothetical protein
MLRRWWRSLWGRPGASGVTGPVPVGPDAADPVPGAVSGGGEDPARGPARRHYTRPPVVDDPQREAHLGAVLEALTDGPLTRAQLARRVATDGWGRGGLDAVLDHGVATGVLVETGDGALRARYAD